MIMVLGAVTSTFASYLFLALRFVATSQLCMASRERHYGVFIGISYCTVSMGWCLANGERIQHYQAAYCALCAQYLLRSILHMPYLLLLLVISIACRWQETTSPLPASPNPTKPRPYIACFVLCSGQNLGATENSRS